MDIASTTTGVRQRITELVAELPEGEAKATRVPTCPEWSVHDVVAHLSGICADVLAGNIAGVATDSWTAAQVAARREISTGDVLAEWSDVGAQVEAFANLFPGAAGAQWVFDMTTHEHDIRTALGRPGARDADGVAIGLDFVITGGLEVALQAHQLPPLRVRAGPQEWAVGEGGFEENGTAAVLERVAAARATAAPSSPTGDADLQAEPFELFRAVTGRRSAAQIRALDWAVDADRYLPAFRFGPFRTSPTDIVE